MSDDKEILLHTRRHLKCLLPQSIAFFGLLALHVLVVMFYPVGWAYQEWVHGVIEFFMLLAVVIPVLRWRAEVFTVSSETVRCDWGILYRQSREIDLTRIASISEERGILDRIFGCGTLNFYDAAAGSQPETRGVWNRGGLTSSGVRFHDVPKLKKARTIVEGAKKAAVRGRNF